MADSINFAIDNLMLAKRLNTKQIALLGENQKDVLPYCEPTDKIKNAVKELLNNGNKERVHDESKKQRTYQAPC